jgi:hypothetical protein
MKIVIYYYGSMGSGHRKLCPLLGNIVSMEALSLKTEAPLVIIQLVGDPEEDLFAMLGGAYPENTPHTFRQAHH